MSSALPPLLRRSLLLPALLLLLGLGATGVHHHAGDETGRACSICALAHSHGMAPALADPTAPAPRPERVDPARAPVPESRAVLSPGCRAPPIA